ncbi:hypothetical protein [Sandarakinorhabdus limnophila]|uniref:hypothetical protein n=1 Tax=Sandarakinorhabdus limnophila TaxID=210512 RepID=UPI0026ED0D5A|nr:hypothetical protein [Sandarakinorhabdus limnophila]
MPPEVDAFGPRRSKRRQVAIGLTAPVEDHWRLHLGQPAFEIPKPQLLIDNLRWHGHVLDTHEQIDALCD